MNLNQKHLEIVRLRDEKHLTFVEISRITGYYRSYVHQLYRQAKRKLAKIESGFPFADLSTRAANFVDRQGYKTKEDIKNAKEIVRVIPRVFSVSVFKVMDMEFSIVISTYFALKVGFLHNFKAFALPLRVAEFTSVFFFVHSLISAKAVKACVVKRVV